MFSAGFETAIPATSWLQTYDLDCRATGIGRHTLNYLICHEVQHSKIRQTRCLHTVYLGVL